MHCQWLIKVNVCGNKMYHRYAYGNDVVARDDCHAMLAHYDNQGMNSSLQDSGSRRVVRRMSILVARKL
jgi:hypothetical protein